TCHDSGQQRKLVSPQAGERNVGCHPNEKSVVEFKYAAVTLADVLIHVANFDFGSRQRSTDTSKEAILIERPRTVIGCNAYQDLVEGRDVPNGTAVALGRQRYLRPQHVPEAILISP